MKLRKYSQFKLVIVLYFIWTIWSKGLVQSSLVLTVHTSNFVKLTIPFLVLGLCGISISAILKYTSFKTKTLSSVKKLIFSSILIFNSIVVLPLYAFALGWETPAIFVHKLFRVSIIKPIFADYQTILDGISCENVKQIGDLINCDVTGDDRIWNYPTILLKLKNIIWVFDNKLIAFTMIAIALNIVLLKWAKQSELLQILTLSVSFISPPILLALNRLNYDVIIFILIIFCYFLINKSKTYYLGIFLLSVTSLLKFYVIFILFYMLFLTKKVNQQIFLIINLFLVVLMLYPDLKAQDSAIGRDVKGSLGLSVLASRITGAETATRSISILTLLIVLIVFINSLHLVKVIHTNGETHKIDFNLIVYFGIPFLASWFLVSNYYYRLILLIPIIHHCLKHQHFKEILEIGICTLFAFFCSPNILGTVQNLLILPVISFIISCIYLKIKIELKRV